MRMNVSNPKDGKSYNTEVEKSKEAFLIGKKMGEVVDGGFANLPGFKLKIKGGSDKDGFPMRADIPGQAKTTALIGSGTGVHVRFKGEKRKKVVVGNTISARTMQVNAEIVEAPADKKVEELIKLAPKKERKG